MKRIVSWLAVAILLPALIGLAAGCAASAPVEGECVGPGCPIPGADGKFVPMDPQYMTPAAQTPGGPATQPAADTTAQR